MILEPTVILGHGYSLTLADVEAWVEERIQAELRRPE
jgi:hypothetical protein